VDVDELDLLRRRYVDAHLEAARWHELTIAGVRCEAFEVGAGPPLVLVHGGLGHCTQWVPLLPLLTPHFRCFAVERPSNGASDEFHHDPAADRRDHVVEVIRDLLDGVGVERAMIAGNSLGGLYALAFAAQHPERVEHLVLVGAPAAHDVELPLPVRLMAWRATGRLITAFMRRSRPQDVRRGEGQLLVAHPERLTDDYLEVAAATQRRNAAVWPRAMRWTVHGRTIHPQMPSTDWAEEAAAAGVPLTYLWGEHDRFVPLEHGRRFASSIGAGFVEIEDAGHLLWLDRPEAAAQAMLEVLLPGGSSTG
jgi:pimeloyl-ACP methyl ester carboxylesterase